MELRLADGKATPVVIRAPSERSPYVGLRQAGMCATPLRCPPRSPPEQPLVRRVEWLFGDLLHLFPVFSGQWRRFN
jgi:hypothetical protein